MTEHNLPSWRVDNLVPIFIIFLQMVFFAGVFITKLDMNTQVIKDLTQEVRDWKKQFEGRLGQEEKISSVVLNVLKLDVK